MCLQGFYKLPNLDKQSSEILVDNICSEMLVSRLSELELPINNAIKKWHQNHFPPLRAGNTCSRHFEMRSHTLDFPLKTNHFQNNILLLFHKRLQGSSCSKCSPLVRIHLLKYVPTRGPPQHIQRYNDTHAHTCVYYIKKIWTYKYTSIHTYSVLFCKILMRYVEDDTFVEGEGVVHRNRETWLEHVLYCPLHVLSPPPNVEGFVMRS